MDGVSKEQLSDADRLTAAADEVEAGRGPIAMSVLVTSRVVHGVSRRVAALGRIGVGRINRGGGGMLPSAPPWGDEPAAGEVGPGLDEAGFPPSIRSLLDDAGAA